ncbi:uncharacterized protein LOC131149553 [Malania oleifera]|uniref:uncharacterized protein LOC131149553 n=1 Tax=Malania oleifera TaxID=397392 RepID=UPI0025AE0DF6|nr:uncharacterized protein LOC131149553 [Malania oleifera]XP_057956082.1 uncharacterized protein LOC131149553 [Malania oleifera]XP_057956083.1 uncharacterized protein LOC131149553 [Malania oleifera]
MADSTSASGSTKNSGMTTAITNKRMSKRCLVTSMPETFSRNAFWHMETLKHGGLGRKTAGHVALFLLEVAALEMVRRLSRAKCPFAWRGLQTLQLLCYPPFKWIQRWAPFKGLVKGVQILSRPLLVLSIATAFSDKSEHNNGTSDGFDDTDVVGDSHAYSESHSELPSEQSTLDIRIHDDDGALQSSASENWLLQLYKELENQGISLPERIDENELHRFYTAANGDFSCLLSSIKKTIHWRDTYNILSGQELEMWSNMLFWHGFDVKQRPCLIVRLGLVCLSLPYHDRPRFAQAVVSQIDHGVLHLVDAENPQITVLVDCEGLSPLKIPMQMMRSCSALLQDHFPNRLGCLFVIRLPPVVRVIAQTFIQVLKPITRKKLRIEGEMYQKVISEHLQVLPSYLGGNCTCTRCSTLGSCKMQQLLMNKDNSIEPTSDTSDDEDLSSPYPATDMQTNGDCNQILRSAMIGILMLWVFVAIIAGMYDAESRQFFPS